jgi:hypothetical protein
MEGNDVTFPKRKCTYRHHHPGTLLLALSVLGLASRRLAPRLLLGFGIILVQIVLLSRRLALVLLLFLLSDAQPLASLVLLLGLPIFVIFETQTMHELTHREEQSINLQVQRTALLCGRLLLSGSLLWLFFFRLVRLLGLFGWLLLWLFFFRRLVVGV